MSNEVVVRGTVLPLTEKARDLFAQDQVDLIAASKAKGADLPTLHAFLELAARYELDPFANEIWCVRMGGKDGGGGQLAILVGRDGYMKIAKRDREFIACPGQAVYEKDDFSAEYVDDVVGWKVEHKIGNPAQRGKLIGGWARLVRKDKPALFFFASLDQFRKNGGAWGYTDAMIVKCATSYLLRTTYNVSGPAPADELAVGFDARTGEILPASEDAVVDVQLPDELSLLVRAAAAIDPGEWRENELLARLPATENTEAYEAAIGTLTREVAAWLDEHTPTEAEVVTDAAEETREPDADAADSEGEEPDGESIEDAERAETVDERYQRDEAWREQVDVLLQRRMDLEAAGDAVDGPEADQVLEELELVEGKLEALGVPRGWLPVASGQASLEV